MAHACTAVRVAPASGCVRSTLAPVRKSRLHQRSIRRPARRTVDFEPALQTKTRAVQRVQRGEVRGLIIAGCRASELLREQEHRLMPGQERTAIIMGQPKVKRTKMKSTYGNGLHLTLADLQACTLLHKPVKPCRPSRPATAIPGSSQSDPHLDTRLRYAETAGVCIVSLIF